MATRANKLYEWATQTVSDVLWYLPEEARQMLQQIDGAVERLRFAKPMRGKLTAAELAEKRQQAEELQAQLHAQLDPLRRPLRVRRIKPDLYKSITDEARKMALAWVRKKANRERWRADVRTRFSDADEEAQAAIIEEYLDAKGLALLTEADLPSPRGILTQAAVVLREQYANVLDYADAEVTQAIEDAALQLDLEALDSRWEEWLTHLEVNLTEQDRAELARVSTQPDADVLLPEGLERKFVQRRAIYIEIRRRERDKERARLSALDLDALLDEIIKGGLEAEAFSTATEWQQASYIVQMAEVPQRSLPDGGYDVEGPWGRLWLDPQDFLDLQTADDDTIELARWVAEQCQARLPGGSKARQAAQREPFLDALFPLQ